MQPCEEIAGDKRDFIEDIEGGVGGNGSGLRLRLRTVPDTYHFTGRFSRAVVTRIGTNVTRIDQDCDEYSQLLGSRRGITAIWCGGVLVARGVLLVLLADC